jgi:hypothetical protein
MHKIFKQDEILVYQNFKRYIVSNSDIPNANRCCVYTGSNIECTICFNDAKMSVCICELTYRIETGITINNIFDYLLYLSEKGNVNKDREIFYLESIEPNSQCCEFNDR